MRDGRASCDRRSDKVSAWYDARYAAGGIDTMRPAAAYPRFLDYLRVQPGRSLLDVGCGTGHLLAAADRRRLHAVGVDVSPEAVQLAQSVAPNAEVLVAAAEALPFADSVFDYVTCLGTLEHSESMQRVLAELRRVSRTDARLCLMVPNVDYFLWRLRRRAGTDQQDVSETLLCVREWEHLLARSGFTVVARLQDTWVKERLGLAAPAGGLRRLRRVALRAAWFVVPLRFTYQVIFLLRKA